MNTDKLVVPLTGALSAAVVLAGVLIAYFAHKDILEDKIGAVDKSISEVAAGMAGLQASYDVRISNLETAKNTDIHNRLKRVEELTSTDQVTGWNQWRGRVTSDIEALAAWRVQTDRLFETNRDAVQRAWNAINKFHGSP